VSDFLDPEEGFTREQLDELQEQRLLEILPYAYEHSALTREVWVKAGVHPRDIRSIDDFRERAPFIDQDTLRDFRARTGDPYAGTLCVRPGELGYLGSTSGTTGNPTPVAHAAMGPTETARGRELWSLGARPGDAVTVMLFSFRSGIDMLVERAPAMGLRRVFLSHTPAAVPRLFDVTREFSPVVLYLLSTPMIIAIDEYAIDHGIDVRREFSCYRAAVYGGEPLGGFARDRIDAWGLTVVQMTSAGDALPATECLERAGCHVWEDQVLVEHLEPNGETPTAAGGPGEITRGELPRGEMVVTSLADRASPLIRFRTNDLVLVDRTQCACGRAHSRIRTLGRTGDVIRVRGRAVLPAEVAPALEGVEACRAGLFQIILTGRDVDVLEVRVGYDRRHGDDLDGLRATVVDALGAGLGVEVDVDLVVNDELLKLGPPHKIPRTVKP
jgi:phenylacetate-CoA ligase